MQACSSTGAPLSETVDFLIEERYVRSVGNQEKVEVHMGLAEPLENEAINIGELLAQSLRAESMRLLRPSGEGPPQ